MEDIITKIIVGLFILIIGSTLFYFTLSLLFKNCSKKLLIIISFIIACIILLLYGCYFINYNPH